MVTPVTSAWAGLGGSTPHSKSSVKVTAARLAALIGISPSNGTTKELVDHPVMSCGRQAGARQAELFNEAQIERRRIVRQRRLRVPLTRRPRGSEALASTRWSCRVDVPHSR